MKLLIVDDAVPLRKRLVSAFTEIDGVRVVGQTGQAHEAIRKFRDLEPDVVTLDIQLPGDQSGIHVLEVIKKEAPETVTIIFTNHGSAPYREHCAAAGADYFFQKNSELKKMLGTLRRLKREWNGAEN